MVSLEPQDSLGHEANAARDSLFKLIQVWVMALRAPGEGHEDDRLNRPMEVILNEVGWPLLLRVESASEYFNDWIKKVTPGRIRDCYSKREKACKVQARNDLEYTSYIEAAAGELQTFIDLRSEDFMLLRLSEGMASLFGVSPPENLAGIMERLAVELPKKQLPWWLEAMRDGAKWSYIFHQYPGIFSDSNGRAFKNDLISLQMLVDTPAKEWQSFFTQVSREESMVRNDYPELFASMKQPDKVLVDDASNKPSDNFPPLPDSLSLRLRNTADDLEREATNGPSQLYKIESADGLSASFPHRIGNEQFPDTRESIDGCRELLGDCPREFAAEFQESLNKAGGIAQTQDKQTIATIVDDARRLAVRLRTLAESVFNASSGLAVESTPNVKPGPKTDDEKDAACHEALEEYREHCNAQSGKQGKGSKRATRAGFEVWIVANPRNKVSNDAEEVFRRDKNYKDRRKRSDDAIAS